MPNRLVFAVLLVVAVLAPATAAAQKLVFVARHAERADAPALDQEDPVLSEIGRDRAVRLGAMLRDAGVDAIYVTKYRRTQQTAAPLAALLGVGPALTPDTIPDLVSTLKARHADDVVLIVGHSSTVPAIVRALSGFIVSLDDSDYTSLFVVVPANGTAVRVRY
jgi:phosphohistidine phosphatase SixA